MNTTVRHISKANRIELHYSLNDNSHLMDAFVQNKCEHEFLGLLREIAIRLSADVIVETEPFGEGGLRRWFKVVSKEENKKGTITTAIIVALLTVILTTPLTKSIEKVIDKIFEDTELQDLEKEKIKLEIEKLKQELHNNEDEINTNVLVKKKKSNFYSYLEGYSKVSQFAIISQNNEKVTIEEKVIKREAFKEFILVSDELEPDEISEAVIEIISPVLKKGNFKWMGVYQGNVIHFAMRSNEFKTLVQTGKIQFKNGTSINCQLMIHKRIDIEGLVQVTKYEVLRVNSYFENDKPIETPEGKSYRQKKEADKRQYKLFNNDDESSENK